ncbi:MAG: hypothetical protein KBT39_01340 [Bacteroidales bacterium]|nr:hypothetical protein [Bacteroidales bacterium]
MTNGMFLVTNTQSVTFAPSGRWGDNVTMIPRVSLRLPWAMNSIGLSARSGEAPRTILTLPFDGHEQDVDAMLELYDDPDELILGEADDKNGDKTAINDSAGDKNGDKTAINESMDDRYGDKTAINSDIGDKNGDKKDLILAFIADNPNSRAGVIADHIGLKASRTREYLTELVKEGKLIFEGANKNRTYSIKK